MRNKSVAVLDIRSSEICAAIAERGVNRTFIIKSKYSQSYEGYAEGEILDVDDFVKAIRTAVGAVVSSARVPVKSIFIGIPCEFCRTEQIDKALSFSSAQRISQRHIDAIVGGSHPRTGEDEKVVRHGALYYVLSDKRKLVDPIGMISDSLRAKTCFFICKTSFINTVSRALSKFPAIRTFGWLPQNYTEGRYLIDADKRDGYSVFLDFGFISSTFNVVRGNGIAFSEAFSVGVGHIAVLLMEALEIPYDVAQSLLGSVNLNAKDDTSSMVEYVVDGERYKIRLSELNDLVKEGLDGVCSVIETCIQTFTPKDLTGAPIAVTGEGVGVIKGAIDHMSSRLVTPFEVIAPVLPYYDKPQFSSLFSLLDSALEE